MYIRNSTQYILIQGCNFYLRDGILPLAGSEMDMVSLLFYENKNENKTD